MRRPAALLLTLGITLVGLTLAPQGASDQLDANVARRMREEGTARSQIMRSLHFLTDVYGPRLSGTPALKAAGDWSIKQMTEWGLSNGHLEPWDFGRPGWVNERLSAHIVAPVKDALVAEALAWTPGTNGPVRTEAFNLIPPESPTREQLQTYLESIKDRVKGRIVLVGRARTIAINFNPPAKREDDQRLKRRYDPAGSQPQPRPFRPQNQPSTGLSLAQISTQIDEFLKASGALVRIADSGRDHGVIVAQQHRNYDPTTTIPTLVMRNEDYGRIARILADGTRVELEIDIQNQLYPEGKTAYTTIAEIPGTDKADEIVMLGGHLDSWHGATGATDNAIGCAIVMEAVRIIKALGLAPRRTIRVALWTGEEEGLLGSRAYVGEHFGTAETPKPDFAKLSAYLNLDGGTGRIRGASVFGPPSAAAVIASTLSAFEDLGPEGAVAERNRRLGSTDHTSFSRAGLPGINFDQDPIEYDTYTHHTNLDTYERVYEQDAQASAIVIAAAAYHLATRDELLPRFAPQEMPPPAGVEPAQPAPRPATAGTGTIAR